MLLTEEQMKDQERDENTASRSKRQVQTGADYPKNKWSPDVPISYRFEESIGN